MLSSNVKKGKDLMLFTTIDGYTSTVTIAPDADSTYVDINKAYVALAFAQTHTLSIQVETSERTSKDHGLYGDNTASKITWEITSENLYVEDNYKKLRNKQLSGTPIYVAFGGQELAHVATNTVSEGPAETGQTLPIDDATNIWMIDTDVEFEYGKALITSLELNATNGEDATYSVTLTGCGPIKTKTAS